MDSIRTSAVRTRDCMLAYTGDALDFLKSVKFQEASHQPVDRPRLNIFELVNRTWPFAVAVAATKRLLLMHTDVSGFRFAPYAQAALNLDIMSVEPGQVSAETFAAVTPRNNGKLAKDLAKVCARAERHRYMFFISPEFPSTQRRPQLERDGVEVWSLEV